MIPALEAIHTVLHWVLLAYQILIFAHIVFSWVRPDPRNPAVRFVMQMTDPAFLAVRRALPFLVAGAIDFSPIVLLLGIQLAESLLDRIFIQLAGSLG